jgi:hypothetical protein
VSEAGWPVRDGQAGIVAGHQPAGHDQKESQYSDKDSKAMMCCIIRRRDQNYSWANPLFYHLRIS